ncbi:hypothetical protein [Rheinheimera hassiensis]|uniref:hypothetical protein n=1 Tax=Rheinheimera hassiensis TaxID=1193627 RepID=UPI001F065FD0|nr:hypothetical protein [Rheinheimera hassiensis]
MDKSPNQIRNLALRRTGISILLKLTFPLLLILIVLLVINYPEVLVTAFCVIFAILLAIAFLGGGYLWVSSTYKRHLAEISGRGDTPTGWKKNKGSQPCSSRVNVQHKNGTVCWRVNADDKDWSLNAENPILEYMDINTGKN